MWLFGRKDTPESLSTEVFGFFNKFEALQTRIQNLVDVKEAKKVEEQKLHDEKMHVERERHKKALHVEEGRYDVIVFALAEDLSVLAKSMALAEKVVKFAEED